MASAIIDASVWGYRVELDGAPIYFGIGSRRRPEHVRRGSHNRALRLLAQKGAPLTVIMTDCPFRSRGDAQQWERDMIAFFGRRDLGQGLLFNFTDGGDGLSSADARRLVKEGRCSLTSPAAIQRRSQTRERQLADGSFVLHRQSVRERNKAAVRRWHQQQLAAGLHPFQDRGTKIKVAEARRQNGTHRMLGVPPWLHFNASARSLEFWSKAPEAIELLNAKVPYAKIAERLGMKPGLSPVQVLVRRIRTGWVPEQDLDWREWARAYRASNPTGEHTHGTDSSGP